MGEKKHGRRKPYTERGIARLPCFRCGDPATQQWQICSDGNLFRPICTGCDIALNNLVLEFMRHPDRVDLVRAYAEKMGRRV